jgi:hypothetical protein
MDRLLADRVLAASLVAAARAYIVANDSLDLTVERELRILSKVAV